MSINERLEAFTLNEERYVGLLRKLIGEAKFLQNNPAQGLIPKEDLAAAHVLDLLTPFSTENGGPLKIERVTFVEGRSNLIFTYAGTTDKIVSFVGSHMDVVPANPSGWDRDPFQLVIEGDMLYGRGTTDCLGHVALLTEFLVTLCEARLQLQHTIVVIFIANEENGTFKGVGVDQLDKEGYMENLKAGPLFWIDAADSQPCIGTAGNAQWQLKVKGKLFHSGLPHKGINSIEMASDAVNYIQSKFYADFPLHPNERSYNYATPSTIKPCQISCTPGALNQLPPETVVEGDVRLTPFYDIRAVEKAVEGYVAEINADPSLLYSFGKHGAHSRYVLPDENKQGILEFKWLGQGENGIACRLDSPGNKALQAATAAVLGSAKAYSIGGSLPLVRELQDSGYDVQISGYGFSNRYHADNECVSLENMKQALRIVSKVVSLLEV
jgi:acetylornithine deacetylase